MLREIVSAYRIDAVNVDKKMEETSPHYTLRWCLKGRVSVALEDDAFLLCAGQVLVLPPFSKIGFKFLEEGTRYAVTSFDLDGGDGVKNILFQPLTAHGNGQRALFDYFYTASQVYGDSDKSCGDAFVKEYAKSTLEGVLLRFALIENGNGRFVLPESSKASTHASEQKLTANVKAYLLSHMAEQVTLADLSHALGASKNAMLRSFRADTGMGIMEYAMKQKIDRAIELIVEGELSFRTISEKLGFQSPEYFSRAFKKSTGMTPTEFSRQSAKWGGCLASMC